MNYLDFKNTFSEMPIFTKSDINIWYPSFDRNALTRWQQKGYIKKIRNGFYCFQNQVQATEQERFFIANRIYAPSYVSLQSALFYYGFIPEAVFSITSISTKKTQVFQSPMGHFTYKTVKPSLFFGYRLVSFGAFRFKMAEPERALLDLLYLNPNYAQQEDFEGLRLNIYEIREQINKEQFLQFLLLFDHNKLNKRANALLKYLDI